MCDSVCHNDVTYGARGARLIAPEWGWAPAPPFDSARVGMAPPPPNKTAWPWCERRDEARGGFQGFQSTARPCVGVSMESVLSPPGPSGWRPPLVRHVALRSCRRFFGGVIVIFCLWRCHCYFRRLEALVEAGKRKIPLLNNPRTEWYYTHTHTHTRTHARTHTHTHTHTHTRKPRNGNTLRTQANPTAVTSLRS